MWAKFERRRAAIELAQAGHNAALIGQRYAAGCRAWCRCWKTGGASRNWTSRCGSFPGIYCQHRRRLFYAATYLPPYRFSAHLLTPWLQLKTHRCRRRGRLCYLFYNLRSRGAKAIRRAF
ncbi:hypothetical protein KCP69_13010 [Salmonella enterica subsp. enterica]|nr:hypothetical protein KCP69_13010 [Salmonella enterica subsp. enterica]